MGVSRGYLGRPGLTAERFVPDPFSGVPGARMYRTGDRARRLADGPLDFLGRMDDQVKVRGFRIELGEIDAVVRAHPGVGDAVVIVREDQPGDKRITAYYAPAAGASAPTAAELRAHAAERLPEHMVPSFFVPLEALPLTPNGKVDKRALPAPDGAAAHTAAFAAAETPVEEKLAAIWKALLGVSRVGANDNFFELGGHSLLLAQVQMRVRDELGEDVPMVDLFRYPTVRSLAARLSGAPEDDGGATLAEKAREKADARRSARSERRDRRGR
jgi:acyl carrier protein